MSVVNQASNQASAIAAEESSLNEVYASEYCLAEPLREESNQAAAPSKANSNSFNYENTREKLEKLESLMDILTQPSDHTRLAQAEVESIKESLTKNIAADELPGLIERLTQATTKLQSLSQKDSTYIKLENEFTGSIEQAATLFKTIDKTLLAVHSLADNVTHQGTDFAPLLAGIANQLQDSFPKLMTTASGQLRALGEHLNARYSAAPEYIQAQEQILIDLYQAYEAVIDYLRAADISSNPSKVDSPREESQEVITAVLSEQAVYDISTPQAEWGYQVITENVAATNWEDFVDQYVAEAQVVEAAAEPVRETERASLPIIDLDSEPQAATVSASVETTSEAIIAEPRKLSLPIVDLDAEPQVSSEPTFVEIITEPNEIEPAVETGINNTQDSEHVLDEEPKQALSDAEAAAETKRIDGSKTVIESREEATARVRKTTIEQATIPAPSKEQHPLVNEFGRELAELGLEYREAHQAQTSVAEAIANLSWKMFSDSIAAGKTLMQKIRSFGNTKETKTLKMYQDQYRQNLDAAEKVRRKFIEKHFGMSYPGRLRPDTPQLIKDCSFPEEKWGKLVSFTDLANHPWQAKTSQTATSFTLRAGKHELTMIEKRPGKVYVYYDGQKLGNAWTDDAAQIAQTFETNEGKLANKLASRRFENYIIGERVESSGPFKIETGGTKLKTPDIRTKSARTAHLYKANERQVFQAQDEE